MYYDPFASSCFNLIYTCWPILVLAIFDRPFTKDISRNCPRLYEKGSKNLAFNFSIFIRYLLLGIFHALIIFCGTIYWIDSYISHDGKTYGFWCANTILFTLIIVVVTAQIVLETRLWMFCNIIWFFLSLSSWFVFELIWTNISLELNWENYYIYGNASIVFWLEKFWIIIILTLVSCIFPELIYDYMQRTFYTTQENLIHELEYFSIVKYNGFLLRIKTICSRIFIKKIKRQQGEVIIINDRSTIQENTILTMEKLIIKRKIKVMYAKSLRKPIQEIYFKENFLNYF